MAAHANDQEQESQSMDETNSQEESLHSPPSGQQVQVVRDDDFTSLYANNIRFEGSVWDLKMLFGELDQSRQSGNTETVVLHTALTIPWATAKLCLYYLALQIAMHELESGKININPRVLPPPHLPPAGDLKDSELAKAGYELAVKMREEFISRL